MCFISFCRKENFCYWQKTINNWIENLVLFGKTWKCNETLSKIEKKFNFNLLLIERMMK